MCISAGIDTNDIISKFLGSADNIYKNENYPITALYTNIKKRFTFVTCERSVVQALDVAKVSDFIVYCTLPESGVVDEMGENMISVIKSQGQPASLGVVVGLNNVAIKVCHMVMVVMTEIAQKRAVHDTYKEFPVSIG